MLWQSIPTLFMLINNFKFVSGKPPPESRKPRAPSYTFGQKHDPPGTSFKPGPSPASYNTEGMTCKGNTTFYIVVCIEK